MCYYAYVNKGNQMSKLNKITIVAILIILITNPWSAMYADYAVERVMRAFVEYSVYVFAVALGVFILLVLYDMYASGKVKIPKTKSKRKY